jgi:hypothetical protein
MSLFRCPICGSVIARANIDLAGPFECPTCGEQLHTVMPGTGKIAATVLVASALVAVLEGVISWPVAVALLIFFPVVRYLLHILFSRVIGPTIEPFTQDGI